MYNDLTPSTNQGRTKMNKFELTNESREVNGVTLYRIRALRDFGVVKAGELGGFVEKEANLSQEGNAWVFGDARVSGKARVFGDACVLGNAHVSGNASVYDNSWVSGDACVSDKARVSGDACVSDKARVFGDACVWDNARVFGYAQVFGDAWVYGNAHVSGNSWVFGDPRLYDNAWVSGNARVYDNAWVSGDARVSGDAGVSGDARVFGDARVSGDARVRTMQDIFWVSNVGSENGTLTFYKTENGISVTLGSFSGTIEEFAIAVEKKHGQSKIGLVYKLLIDTARLHIE
jgi:carbonic anhydrase/acetyltransferase-like protein (isoleucine patch superfamily)